MNWIKQYNFEGCSVVIMDGSDLWSTLLRWPQVAWYTYPVSTIGSGIRVILREYSTTRATSVGITDGKDLWCTWLRWLRVAWYTLTSLMKIGIGVEAILRFCLRNFNGCKGFTKWSVQIGSGGIMNMYSFVKFGVSVQAVSRVLTQKFERL
jgi:hypothetical protein